MTFWLGQGKQVFLEYRIIQVQTNLITHESFDPERAECRYHPPDAPMPRP